MQRSEVVQAYAEIKLAQQNFLEALDKIIRERYRPGLLEVIEEIIDESNRYLVDFTMDELKIDLNET